MQTEDLNMESNNILLLHEQIIITLWYIIALLFCLLGNCFVLHGTTKHRAIKLDKMSVWIIQNLCVADLCRGLFNVFPTIITLTTGYTWSTFCTILLAIKYCFIDATSFFVNALVINKLYRCLVPLACPPERRHRLLVTAGGVATSCIYMCITIYQAVMSSQVSFIQDYMGCAAEGGDEEEKVVSPSVDVILSLLVVIVPITTLVFCNTALLVLARAKGRSQVKRKNVLIVLVTTTVFFISNFPYVLWCLDFYNLIHLFESRTLVTYTRFTFIVMQTSCFINPFIYYFTNKGFRRFCKKTVVKRGIIKELPGDTV